MPTPSEVSEMQYGSPLSLIYKWARNGMYSQTVFDVIPFPVLARDKRFVMQT